MEHAPSPFHILPGAAIRAALPLEACIAVMREAMMAVSRGEAHLPLRMAMAVPGHDARLGLMPGHLARPDTLGAKLLCLMPGNPARGLSSHLGVMLLFDPDTGRLAALLDAAAVTALRTPAATAAASKALARPDAGDLAIIGTGEQARAHLDAMAIVHPLRRVRIWGRDAARAAAFADWARGRTAAPVAVAATVREAVAGADLVCTVTASHDPILRGDWIDAGTHINLVGASLRHEREIDSRGVARARYFVDHRASAMAQAGELADAIEEGAVGADHIVAEIGEVFLGLDRGRTDRSEITIYKSLGNAAQDLAASTAALDAAIREGLGTSAEL